MPGPWEKYQQKPWERFARQEVEQPEAPSIARESTLKIAPLAIAGLDWGTVDTGIPLGEGATAQLTRAGRGIQDFWQGLNQLVRGQEYTDQVNAEIDTYQKGLEASGHEGTDWMRGFGTAATPLTLLPGGGQTKAAQAGLGALSGGVTGATLFNPSGKPEDRLANTATGAVVGAVAAPLAKTVLDKAVQGVSALAHKAGTKLARDSIVRQIRGTVGQSWDDLGKAQQDAFVDEVQRQLNTSGVVDPEMLTRKANLIANDVTPTKSMVTRNPADWAVERNLQKVAGPGDTLADLYRSNDQALANRLQNVSGALPEGTQEAQGMRVMQSIKDLSDATQEQVGALYEQVRKARGEDLASDARHLMGALEELRDSTYAEKLVGSVANKLKRFGMIDDQGNLTSSTLTVKQAEELRKFVNKLPNDFGKRDIIAAIDRDVLEGLGEDAFKGARDAAAARFDLLGNPAIQKALGAWDELSQGKTAQNFIKSQIVDAAEQDVASLMRALQVMDDPTPSLQSMRAGVLDYLQSKAVNPNSNQFSGAGLARAIRQIGPGKLKMVLGDEAFSRLESLSKAALDATYQPAYSAVNHSNTAPTLLRYAETARKVPFVPTVLTDPLVEGMEQNANQRLLQQLLQAPPVDEAARAAQERARRELTARLLRSAPAVTGAAYSTSE